MKVKKIMTADVGFCFVEENLSRAVEVMWQRDCGVVPVVNAEMIVAGMVTDRDVAIAVSSRGKKSVQIKLSEVVGGKIVSCLETDEAEAVLKKMRRAKVRRLPVVSGSGALLGIVSITDFILKAPKLRKKVYSVLRSLAKPRPIVLREIAETDLSADAPEK